MAIMSSIYYHFFRKTLDQDALTKVALIGVGNLGTALLQYNFTKNNNTKICYAFDTNEEKIGTQISDVTIYSLDQLEEILNKEEIQVVILTVPAQVAAISNRPIS